MTPSPTSVAPAPREIATPASVSARPESARIDAGKRRSRVPKRSDCTAEMLRARRGLNGANYQQSEQSRVRVRPVMLKEAGWFESERVLTTLLS